MTTNKPQSESLYVEPLGFKGTPGEWKKVPHVIGNFRIEDADGVERVCAMYNDYNQSEPNAQLISQSKELAKVAEPFAKMWDAFTNSKKYRPDEVVFAYNDVKLTVKDFENAKQVLKNAGL